MAGVFIAYGMRGATAIGRYRARKKMAGADEVLSTDPRPTVLYLRSFQVDNRGGLLGAGGPLDGSMKFLGAPVEEVVADDLATLGPVVAIGKPGERLKPLGAARLYCEDDEWQARVLDLITTSSAIVMLCELPSDGFRWEIERIVEHADPTTLLGVVMVEKYGGDAYTKWAAAVRKHLPRGLPRSNTLPDREMSDHTDVRAWLTFADDWTPRFTAIHHGMLDPTPSAVLAEASWVGLERGGARLASALPRGSTASILTATAELLRSIQRVQPTRDRLLTMIDDAVVASDSFAAGVALLGEAGDVADQPAEMHELTTAAAARLDGARLETSSQPELALIELHLGLTHLCLGSRSDAAAWFRAAYDRAAELVRAASNHSDKVAFGAGDHEFTDVDAASTWVTEYLTVKEHRRVSKSGPVRSGLELYCSELLPVVNCAAALCKAASPRARPRPLFTIDKTYSLLRTKWVSLEIAATTPTPKPASTKTGAKKSAKKTAKKSAKKATAKKAPTKKAPRVSRDGQNG